MFEWEGADIKYNISSKSVKDSNLVLRKFYNELAMSTEVAWNYQTYREGNTIFVGSSSFGDMWLDYREKGLIQNIYISTMNNQMHDIVKNALGEAVTNHDTFKVYDISLVLRTNKFVFNTMCRKKIAIEPILVEDGKNAINVTFSVNAFGDFDLQYVIVQKINYLKHLLCMYTNYQFEMLSEYTILKNVNYVENSWMNYDIDWLDDFSDNSKNSECVELIPDFFDVFRIILDNDTYEKTMRLVLNSAQEAYCGKIMINDVLNDAKYNIPGYVDVIDAVLISALEPLSNIGTERAEKCLECGNLKYKIRKKVEILCKTYMNDYLTKEISDIGYGRRSSFFHEGNARTNEFYCGRCMPLINPNTGNTMLNVSASVNFALFEYVTYIFRHKVHDLLIAETFLA